MSESPEISVLRLVLDVLKPHSPNVLEFANAIAAEQVNCHIKATVVAVDEKTESIRLVIEGDPVSFDAATKTITSMGGSLHSIDEAEVMSQTSGNTKEDRLPQGQWAGASL